MATNRTKGDGSPIHIFRGKYKPEEFIVPGQDNNGVSMRIHCRIAPLLDRAVDILVGSKRFPFRTKGDLMRWCIYEGVKALDNMEPVTGSVLIQSEAMIKILHDEEINHTFMTVFQTMMGTVGMHIQAQAIGEARRVVSEMNTQIMRMETGYWRSRYLKELETKFGYLLQGESVAGASMSDFDDHGDE